MTYTESDLFRFHDFFKNFHEISSSEGLYKMQGDRTLYTKEMIIQLFNEQNEQNKKLH